LLLKGKQMLPAENSTYFLHVFHHTVTARHLLVLVLKFSLSLVTVRCSIGFVVMWDPVSVGYLGPLTNSFVHIFMYAYYFLAELNLIDRRLGGKFITPLQLAQFFLCLLSGIYETLHLTACGTGLYACLWLWLNYGTFFFLFLRLYQAKARERAQPKQTAGKAIKKE